MYIFVDESGIHKTIDHSAFALVYVSIENHQTFERQVLDLENELKIKAFHWAETSWKIK